MAENQSTDTVEHVLTLDCPETRGIVHAVSGFLLDQGCDILESKQFDSQLDGHFFMRLHFAVGRGPNHPGFAAGRISCRSPKNSACAGSCGGTGPNGGS